MPVGLLVPADEQMPVSTITVRSLADFQRAVGGDIEVVVWHARSDVAVYVWADAKQHDGTDPNPRATTLLAASLRLGDGIAGPMLLLGFDFNSGEDVDCPADLVDLFVNADMQAGIA